MTLESMAGTEERKQRELCSRCRRVTPRSCLCQALPAERPILSLTKVVVLQHPHEFQHKTNRSVPLLDLCLPLELCVGRRLGDQIPETIQAWLRPPHLPILIFPKLPEERDDLLSKKVLNLSEIQNKISEWQQKGHTLTKESTSLGTPKVVLLVLDATWKYAKEMHRANAIHYPSHMLRMSLDGEDDLPRDFQPRRFELRTTPQRDESSSGWMSTAECVSWIVSKLENQPAIYHATIQVLDAAVLQHRSFIAENKKKRNGESEEPRAQKKQRRAA